MKTGINFVIIISLIISVSSCVSTKETELTRKVAATPSDFVGKSVRVCGYVRNQHEDHGIFLTRRSYRNEEQPMLGLDSAVALHNTKQCLSGIIIRTGCGEDMICLDYAVPYSLKTEIKN